MKINQGHFARKRCFVTGHTGFKGSWLSLWLHYLGAQVHGYALDPPTKPSAFLEAGLLTLDSSAARHDLGWKPQWDFETALRHTIDWHRTWLRGDNMHDYSLRQIEAYQTSSSL